MTRLDQNRATAQLAMKAGVKISAVKGVIIWGNHSSTQLPDAEHATIAGKRAAEVIQDADWLGAQFVPTVQKRGAAVIAARKLSSAMSAAKAACDHMASWWRGTAGDWVSMGVFSDGSYGTPAGVMFSFPVTIKDGQWAIVQVTTIYRVSQKKVGSRNIIVFHELLSLGCINFKNFCAYHEEEVLRFPKHPQLTKFA